MSQSTITIDQYSVATVPIQMLFNTTELGLGTGFLWQEDDALFLITNWHNLSGRDPFTGKHISATAAEPNQLRVWWNQKGNLGSKFAIDHPIKDANGSALWSVHPTHKNQVDAVALPITLPPNAEPYAINKMPADDLLLQVGMDVFILGYPFGISSGGFPIWKRGSIASEPQLLEPARPVIFVDSASRPGMSGSPVIRRSWNSHAMANGSTAIGPGSATKIVGIYSGRLATSDPNDPQLGLTWPVAFDLPLRFSSTRS